MTLPEEPPGVNCSCDEVLVAAVPGDPEAEPPVPEVAAKVCTCTAWTHQDSGVCEPCAAGDHGAAGAR